MTREEREVKDRGYILAELPLGPLGLFFSFIFLAFLVSFA